ncbi:MAG: hypothetical protein PVF34_05230, partial [Gammaproteobacteria bacterium]
KRFALPDHQQYSYAELTMGTKIDYIVIAIRILMMDKPCGASPGWQTECNSGGGNTSQHLVTNACQCPRVRSQ